MRPEKYFWFCTLAAVPNRRRGFQYNQVRMPERDVSISFRAPLSTSHCANSSPNPPRPPVMMLFSYKQTDQFSRNYRGLAPVGNQAPHSRSLTLSPRSEMGERIGRAKIHLSHFNLSSLIHLLVVLMFFSGPTLGYVSIANELAYDAGALRANFCHVGCVHRTSSGSLDNCLLFREIRLILPLCHQKLGGAVDSLEGREALQRGLDRLEH
ncbi:hypothetical protein QYF61_022983 [Mycteria americana]|uniref:Uncharacterized protein n=1 Tax=Mycteria americana TaxID=33587 RepID=A0AAN7NAZ3_MYCAM|nr:hypothetical protein QYF61_022983 [Mycteria americana]